MAIIKKTRNNKFCKNVEKREWFCHVAGKVNWYSCCGKQYGIASKNETQSHHMILQFYCWISIPKKKKKKKENTNSKDTCTSIFIAALFTIAKIWNPPVSTDRNKYIYLFTMEHYPAIKKNEILSSVRTWYYVEWNKSDRERNTTWFHLQVESKKENKQIP